MTPADKEKQGRSTIRKARTNGVTRTEIRLSPAGRQAVNPVLVRCCDAWCGAVLEPYFVFLR